MKNNIKEVCLHQIQDNIKDLKFVISFALIIILMILNGIVFSLRSEKKNSEYLGIIQSNEVNIKKNSKSLNNIAFSDHLVLKKPLYSEFIAEGKQNIFPDAFFVKVNSISLPEKIYSYNKRLTQITSIDWVFIISILFSFLIFILTYDAISGEKEKKTLQILFSNSITKLEYILGKITGVTLSVMLPFIIGIIINLIIIIVLGKFPINASLCLRILVFVFYSFIFISIFVSIGLFISSINSNSLKSLIILSLFWITIIIITPVVSKIIITNIYKVTTTADLDEKLKEVESRLPDLYAAHQAGERGPMGAVDNFKLERGAAAARNEIASEKQKIIKEYLRLRINQAKAYYNLINLSPVYLYQNIIEDLFNTGLTRETCIIDQTNKFQDQIITFYKENDIKDIRYSAHLYFMFGYLSPEGIDYNLVPRFNEDPIDISQSIKNSLSLFILLLTEFLVITILICFTFKRMNYL